MLLFSASLEAIQHVLVDYSSSGQGEPLLLGNPQQILGGQLSLLLQQVSVDREPRSAHSRVIFCANYLTSCTLKRRMAIGDGSRSLGGTGGRFAKWPEKSAMGGGCTL